MASDPWIKQLMHEQRIKIAKEKMVKVVDHFTYLLSLHANNEFVVYSPTLSSQVPRSFAANAFNIFVRSMYHFEVVRLCALWDSPKPEKENITTVVELIDDPAIIEMLAEHASLPWQGDVMDLSSDPDLSAAEQRAISETEKRFGIQAAVRAKVDLAEAISDARAIVGSAQLQSVINLRDKHLAHSLATTYREQRGPVPPMKVGDETDLMMRSIPIVEKLYRCVNGVSFSIESNRQIDQNNAEALWKGCRFQILQ